jgi:ATP-binding cassette subfamily F protein uup
VLDEPTNDLDLETLDVLEEMLDDYAGTVLLVSHDRDFLDRVVSFVIVPEGDGRWQEYAGGYSDMLSQRGADLKRAPVKATAKPADKPKASPSPTANPPSERKRLTFKDKHALETLPETIAALQAEIGKLAALLEDHTLYARDRKRFDQTSSALADAQRKLAEAEERWLALEILREEIEGQ